ncbi:MAG TPA: hypothetical protein VFS66_13280 [Acidimicrobiia bacterium]|nr:hypothetical protein [Acidimicrobiia bacterium]
MTHRAVGFGRGFPRIWILPIAALTILLGIAASGRLSRSIVADLIAWWPVWVGLGVAAFVFRDRKVGSVRLSGLIPLIALFFVLLFTWGHLAGWAIMPSASQRLVGPEVGSFSDATLEASIDGRIVLAGGSEFLYEVEPLMQGGVIGIPAASEQVTGSEVSIELAAPADPGLYGYAGWEILVSTAPLWYLDLDGALELDLTEVSVGDLVVSGAGTVILGPSEAETSVSVEGAFEVVVPDGTPARVVGVASVPADWTRTPEGATAPGGGTGWVITVVGDTTLNVTGR